MAHLALHFCAQHMAQTPSTHKPKATVDLSITPLCPPSNKTIANVHKEQLGRSLIKPGDLMHNGNVSCLKITNLVSGRAKGSDVGPPCNLESLIVVP